MTFRFSVHIEESSAPSGRFRESSVYRTKHLLRFRPFDPLGRQKTATTVSIKAEWRE